MRKPYFVEIGGRFYNVAKFTLSLPPPDDPDKRDVWFDDSKVTLSVEEFEPLWKEIENQDVVNPNPTEPRFAKIGNCLLNMRHFTLATPSESETGAMDIWFGPKRGVTLDAEGWQNYWKLLKEFQAEEWAASGSTAG